MPRCCSLKALSALFLLATSSCWRFGLSDANPNGLASTPPLGWRSWNFMKQDVSQEKILAQVSALVETRAGRDSLLEVGYSHIGIDDGWQACGTGFNGSFHDEQGRPLINLTRFPDMRAMNTQAHAKGVKMGWYGNNCGCKESMFDAIGGHVKQDAQATADLLFDSIKIDGCGPSQNITLWAEALNATGRPILLEDCLTKRYTRQGLPAPVPLEEVFAECPGNFFRLENDIGPQFYSTMYNLISTYNLMTQYQSLPSSPASRPGCWTYSDMLEVGNGLDLVESRSHFAAFAITSSPLVLGFDLTNRTLYDELYPIIANKRVISINQQWAGNSGVLVANSSQYFSAATAHGASGKSGKKVSYPVWQVWQKPLARPAGGIAVLAINLSEEEQDKIEVSFAELGLPAAGARVSATDAWTGEPVRPTVVSIGRQQLVFEDLGRHDCVFLILSVKNVVSYSSRDVGHTNASL